MNKAPASGLFLKTLNGLATNRCITPAAYELPLKDHVDKETLLRNMPLFEDLAADELQALAVRLAERVVAAGEVVFRAGEQGSTLYLIQEGVVEIAAGDGVDRAATEAAMREAGLYALADTFKNDGTARAANGSGGREPGDARVEAMVSAGLAITGDGTRLSARWPSVGWQLLAYVVITAAEILVSITCLEFSYTQAPPQMKSFIMSLYLLSVSLGNLFTALVNTVTQDAAGHSLLSGAAYYWFFCGCMAAATVLLLPVMWTYRNREYLQDEQLP